MVRKKTLLLSMVFSVLLVAMIHTNYVIGYDYASPIAFTSSEFTKSFGEMGTGAFAIGVLVEYVVFMVVIYMFLRGIVKSFEK